MSDAPIMHEEPRDYDTFVCDGIGEWAEDPFAAEIYDDYTPVWMCECQRYEAAMDV